MRAPFLRGAQQLRKAECGASAALDPAPQCRARAATHPAHSRSDAHAPARAQRMDAGLEYRGVHECPADCIFKSDLDLRKTLFSQIVLAGGSTMYAGYGDRLLNEARAASSARTMVQMHTSSKRQPRCQAAFADASLHEPLRADFPETLERIHFVSAASGAEAHAEGHVRQRQDPD